VTGYCCRAAGDGGTSRVIVMNCKGKATPATKRCIVNLTAVYQNIM
jgi:hypothetical protein